MGMFNKLMGNAGVVAPEKLHEEFGRLLFEGEKIEVGYKVFRDVFIFTTHRLILVDKQGLTGRKVEYKTVGYKAISRFSVETAGTFDLDAELKIWISSDTAPSVSKKFDRNVDVYELQQVLAHHCLS